MMLSHISVKNIFNNKSGSETKCSINKIITISLIYPADRFQLKEANKTFNLKPPFLGLSADLPE